MSYYDVPEEYGARGHRYTVVNGHTVLVERGTGRIVEIVDGPLPRWLGTLRPGHRRFSESGSVSINLPVGAT